MSVQSITSPREPSRLGIAFAAALLLHGTALAALTLWPSKESVTPPGEQEITIDLAPALEEAVSVAPAEMAAVESPPIEAEPLPVEPETVEALPPEETVEDQPEEVTAVEEPQPVTETAPVEAMQAEPAAPEVEAIVAVPPPETVVARPVEEKAEPKPEKKTLPKPIERKPVERKPAPRRAVAERPAPPSNANQGQASSSRENMGGSAASANPAARNRYLASLVAALQRRLRYPDVARSQGVSGVAQVRFTLDRSGRVVSASLVRSAGHPALDQAALATTAPGSSVPPVPDFIPQLTYTIPLRFNLR